MTPSSKFREIKVPEPGSMYDDGLTKDFTGQFPNPGQVSRQHYFTWETELEGFYGGGKSSIQ